MLERFEESITHYDLYTAGSPRRDAACWQRGLTFGWTAEQTGSWLKDNFTDLGGDGIRGVLIGANYAASEVDDWISSVGDFFDDVGDIFDL